MSIGTDNSATAHVWVILSTLRCLGNEWLGAPPIKVPQSQTDGGDLQLITVPISSQVCTVQSWISDRQGMSSVHSQCFREREKHSQSAFVNWIKIIRIYQYYSGFMFVWHPVCVGWNTAVQFSPFLGCFVQFAFWSLHKIPISSFWVWFLTLDYLYTSTCIVFIYQDCTRMDLPLEISTQHLCMRTNNLCVGWRFSAFVLCAFHKHNSFARVAFFCFADIRVFFHRTKALLCESYPLWPFFFLKDRFLCTDFGLTIPRQLVWQVSAFFEFHFVVPAGIKTFI